MNTEPTIRRLFELFSSFTDANYRTLIQGYPWIPEDRSELLQSLRQNPQLALSAEEDLRFVGVLDERSLVRMLRRRIANQNREENLPADQNREENLSANQNREENLPANQD